ncbi:hypothetical protein RB195_024717 [Necator americanus]|uniref:Uncharacterized protein n=1 Tax=Necator americanus TaxID=51031 RepID=A0ABR1EPD1_NECAM
MWTSGAVHRIFGFKMSCESDAFEREQVHQPKRLHMDDIPVSNGETNKVRGAIKHPGGQRHFIDALGGSDKTVVYTATYSIISP